MYIHIYIYTYIYIYIYYTLFLIKACPGRAMLTSRWRAPARPCSFGSVEITNNNDNNNSNDHNNDNNNDNNDNNDDNNNDNNDNNDNSIYIYIYIKITMNDLLTRPCSCGSARSSLL